LEVLAMDTLIAEIVRVAITVVRNERILKVADLTQRLAEMYPGKDYEISSALGFWAKQERRHH
jgi:hypothetical protein